MAQNGLFQGQICLSRQPGGSPSALEWVHWGLGPLNGEYSLARSDRRQIWDKKCCKRSKNSVFMTPSGLFRQGSERLCHGKNFFRAPEGVPKYTKKAKSVEHDTTKVGARSTGGVYRWGLQGSTGRVYRPLRVRSTGWVYRLGLQVGSTGVYRRLQASLANTCKCTQTCQNYSAHPCRKLEEEQTVVFYYTLSHMIHIAMSDPSHSCDSIVGTPVVPMKNTLQAPTGPYRSPVDPRGLQASTGDLFPFAAPTGPYRPLQASTGPYRPLQAPSVVQRAAFICVTFL